MRQIKIPLQDFALKMQGGLMREGERICGTLRYYVYIYMYIYMYVWYMRIPYIHILPHLCVMQYFHMAC